jgi:hypothetical protein
MRYSTVVLLTLMATIALAALPPQNPIIGVYTEDA